MTYRGWESASAALRRRRIKLGVVSSDFGVHPVATLVRGLIQLIDRRKVRALPPPLPLPLPVLLPLLRCHCCLLLLR